MNLFLKFSSFLGVGLGAPMVGVVGGKRAFQNLCFTGNKNKKGIKNDGKTIKKGQRKKERKKERKKDKNKNLNRLRGKFNLRLNKKQSNFLVQIGSHI